MWPRNFISKNIVYFSRKGMAHFYLKLLILNQPKPIHGLSSHQDNISG